MMHRSKQRTSPSPPDHVEDRIAQLIRENNELRRINVALQQSNQDLEAFAYAASHDLQDPLLVISVYADLLKKRAGWQLDKEVALGVEIIAENAMRMKVLLTDLLSYAGIRGVAEAGTVVDLNRVLDTVKNNLHIVIEESGAAITCTKLPVLSAAHEVHFVQLFQNLLANAIKYRGPHTPSIHISVQEKGGVVEFAVMDNGLGVASEYHEKIFRPFQRLRDNESSGSGIGLSICQRVVERYGGRIWVESQIGAGATFRFTLPNVEVRQAASSAPDKSTRVTIVLVDDNPADVSLLRLALNEVEVDCELLVINDGAEAITFVQQQNLSTQNPPPDLAVLDFNLPRNSGLDILKAMRDTPTFAAVPVVVLSSGLSPRDAAEIQEFSLARYIPKPSTWEDFRSLGSRLRALIKSASNERGQHDYDRPS